MTCITRIALAGAVVAGFVFSTARSNAADSQPLLYTVPFQAGDGRYLIYRISRNLDCTEQAAPRLR